MNLKLRKMSREAVGEDRADRLSALVRMGAISVDEVKDIIVEALRESGVCFVFDERPGRR